MHIYDQPQRVSRDRFSHNPHVFLFLFLPSSSVSEELAFTKLAFRKSYQSTKYCCCSAWVIKQEVGKH